MLLRHSGLLPGCLFFVFGEMSKSANACPKSSRRNLVLPADDFIYHRQPLHHTEVQTMTNEQKHEILLMKKKGAKYTEIAAKLGLPLTTVKSYCYRHSEEISLPRCPQCGKEIQQAKFKPRRFCSDACRAQYWREHAGDIVRSSAVSMQCPVCRSIFADYPYRHRKYCSHACYITARYHGGRHYD